MSTADTGGLEYTRPVDLEAPKLDSSPDAAGTGAAVEGQAGAAVVEPPPVAAAAAQPVFVPMAVTVGDGFKFGCGFFLALALVMLLGFVLLSALFALVSVLGLSLPVGR